MDYTDEQVKEAAEALWSKLPYSYLGSFQEFAETNVGDWCERVVMVVLNSITPMCVEKIFENWTPVPLEPTEDMLACSGVDPEEARAIWTRMIYSAPEPPTYFSDVIQIRKLLEEVSTWMMAYKVKPIEAMAEELPAMSEKIFDVVFSLRESV